MAQLPSRGIWLARGAASIHLAALGILLTTAWRDSAPGDGTLAGFAGWHLTLLLITGAAAALLTLQGTRPGEGGISSAAVAAQSLGVAELMAQMSHELRTPLNAVIGFSEVMLRELHGPLGHARYQEYAHHISESGGRLLKSSEQALAITEVATALVADRPRARRERVLAETIVLEAWHRATSEAPHARVHLATARCIGFELICERPPTTRALEYLLREALAHASPGCALDIVGQRRGPERSLTIRMAPARPAIQPARPHSIDDPAEGCLRVGLARLLLQAQGAALLCNQAADGTWSARLSFPAGR